MWIERCTYLNSVSFWYVVKSLIKCIGTYIYVFTYFRCLKNPYEILFGWLAVPLLCYWLLRSEIDEKTVQIIICSLSRAYILLFSLLDWGNRVTGCFHCFKRALKMRKVYRKISFMHVWKIFFQTLSAPFERLCSPHVSLSVSLAFEKQGCISNPQHDYIINKRQNCDPISCNSCNIHEWNSESSNS